MPTVSNDPRPPSAADACWANCARCDALFPADPGQLHCRHCESSTPSEARLRTPFDFGPVGPPVALDRADGWDAR